MDRLWARLTHTKYFVNALLKRLPAMEHLGKLFWWFLALQTEEDIPTVVVATAVFPMITALVYPLL